MGDDVEEAVESLADVTHGAVVGSSGILGQRIASTLLNIALAQGLSVSIYGVYAFGYRIVNLLTRFTKFGANQTLLRFIPKYDDDPDRQDRTVGLAYVTAGAISSTAGVVLFLFAPELNAMTLERPVFIDTMRAFAFLVPFYTMVHIVASVFRSVKLVEYQVGLQQIGEPVVRLLGVVVALALGFSVVGVAVAVTLLVGLAAASGFVVSLWRTDLRPAVTRSRSEIREFFEFTLPVSLATLGAVLRSRVDVIIVGSLLTSSAAGVYNAALLLTSFIGLPLAAFNQLMPPVASQLYSDGEMETLQAVYSTVTRWVFTVSLAVVAVQLVYRRQLLELFGTEFTRGQAVLAVFVAARLSATMVGSTGWLLMMTDHQRVEAVNSWLLGIVNIGLSYALTLEVGLIGAAIGTGGSLALINFVRVAELWYLEGLMPFSSRFLKPAVAVVPMSGAMWATQRVVSGLPLVVAGGTLGLVVYVLVLRGLGIEDRDRQMYRAMADRYDPQRVIGSD